MKIHPEGLELAPPASETDDDGKLPKVSKPTQLKDYRPIALTSCLCKSSECLIKSNITANTVSDASELAYKSCRSTQDVISQFAPYVT